MSTSPVLTNVPLPLSDRVIELRRPGYKQGEDPQEGMAALTWVQYWTQQGQVLGQSPSRVGSSGPLSNQSVSIVATDLSNGTLSAGLYELRYFAHVTQAAGATSSLIVTFDWTTDGQPMTFSFPAMTGNTLATFQSDILPLLRIDGSSPVRYSTTYASTGAPSMQYSLDVTLSIVQT